MQAIDRTHRLGQHRPIRAVRFIAEGTVEERVLQLQEKKRLVFDGTVGRYVVVAVVVLILLHIFVSFARCNNDNEKKSHRPLHLNTPLGKKNDVYVQRCCITKNVNS